MGVIFLNESFCKTCGADLMGATDSCPHCGTAVKKSTPVILMVGIVAGVALFGLCVIGIIAAIMLPNYLMTRAKTQLTQCQGNERLIGTALELYRDGNQGHYPQSLSMLCPKYLSAVPTCSAVEKDTYSTSYSASGDGTQYNFYCAGSYHRIARVATNCPQYGSSTGIVTKPLTTTPTRRRGST